MDARSFLEKVLANGLDEGIVQPADVVRHAEPQVLAHHLPVELRAKLLAASLSSPVMSADLVVTTVGTLALAAHVPVHLLWAVIAECAARALGSEPVASEKPAAKPADAAAKPAEAAKPTATASGSSAAIKPPSGALPGSGKRAETAPVARADSKPESTKTDVKQIEDLQPKPNAKAKAEPPKAEPAKGSAPTKPPPGKSDAKSGPVPSDKDKERTRTSPIIPRSEFEVDTDVGEWGSDDIVDIVEEADVVGVVVEEPGTDWKADEETVNRFKKR